MKLSKRNIYKLIKACNYCVEEKQIILFPIGVQKLVMCSLETSNLILQYVRPWEI